MRKVKVHITTDERYEKKQGYNDRLDDTLGMKDGAESWNDPIFC